MTFVAFGSFYAARVHGSAVASFAATLVGNLAGAMGVYALGRRYGRGWMQRRFRLSDDRLYALERQYRQRGVFALFLSRFVPGFRAVVPPFAGAFHVPPVRAGLAMGIASGIWYGLITWLAFRAGDSWEELSGTIARYGRLLAIVAAALALAAGLWFWMRRRRAPRDAR